MKFSSPVAVGLWSRVGGWGFDAGFCGCWFRVDLLGSEQMREDGGGAIGEQIGADWGFCCGLWVGFVDLCVA